MVYDTFNMLLNLIYLYFVKICFLHLFSSVIIAGNFIFLLYFCLVLVLGGGDLTE